jgi:putative AbiEii toxin of type IV toxin-antitoxin system
MMLYRLEVENFYSIRDRQVIDLRAAANAPAEPGRLAPLWKGAEEKAPKVVALFGANASGKSNVLKALSFIVWFVNDSFSTPRGSRLPFQRFNDQEMLQSPTRSAIHLAGLEDMTRMGDPDAAQCRYAYEVKFGGGAEPCVDSETLHYWPVRASHKIKLRKIKLFERDATGAVTAAKAFGLTGFRQALGKVLRPNVSVIATLAQLEHPFSKIILNAASLFNTNILVERHEGTDDHAIRYYAANPKLIEIFNGQVERIDLGIQKMQVQQGPNGPIAFFTHEGLAVPMQIIYESHGTRQFIRISPWIWRALETGGVAVLDELDSSIHPMLLPEILRWFYDPERNPHDAQLWMSCQNASLLEDLIKEEVLFCEKDRSGRTQVYGLRDIQSVRRTDNYYRKYLSGAFGAVPQIG